MSIFPFECTTFLAILLIAGATAFLGTLIVKGLRETRSQDPLISIAQSQSEFSDEHGSPEPLLNLDAELALPPEFTSDSDLTFPAREVNHWDIQGPTSLEWPEWNQPEVTVENWAEEEPPDLPLPDVPRASPEVPDFRIQLHPVMSEFERSFYWALTRAVGGEYHVFPQVPLRELVRLIDRRGFSGPLSRVYYRGVLNFLLVRPMTLEGVVALELEQASHHRSGIESWNRQKEQFLRMVRLSLVRHLSDGDWNHDLLRQQIQEAAASSRPIVFLTEKERQFFWLFREARPDLLMFPKVPLNVICRAYGPVPGRAKLLTEETCDYVLTHPRYPRTLIAVDLDRPANIEKEELLREAGVPFLEINKGPLPTSGVLRVQIAQATRALSVG